MAKKNDNQNIARQSNSISETWEAKSANLINKTDDDLIVSLAERRENARARQVFEWETTRRQATIQTVWQNAA